MNLSELLEEGISMNLALGEAKPVSLNAAVRRVHAKFPLVTIPEFENLEERLTIFLERLSAENWSGYKLNEASSLARDFFGSDMATDNRWEAIKDDFLTELQSNKKSFVRGCFTGYLASFKERSSLTKQLADALQSVDQSAFGSMSKFAKRFDALSPQGLPDRIASDLLEHEEPYEKIREYGVGAPHAFALFDDVFVELVDQIEPKMKAPEPKALGQIKNWLKPNAEYKMATGYNIGVEAILKPFLKETPSDDTKKDILNFLLDAYGDPRISKAGWAPIDPKCIEIVHKWLTGESLKTFFKIIAEFEGGNMWNDRHTYWEMIFDEGLIQDAWPILHPFAVKKLENLAAQDKNNNFLRYGKIKDTGKEPTCYFAMKIDNLIVVEGSHNFAIRFFKVGNKSATPMHKTRYDKKDLVIAEPPADKWLPHNKGWETRASKYLQANR